MYALAWPVKLVLQKVRFQSLAHCCQSEQCVVCAACVEAFPANAALYPGSIMHDLNAAGLRTDLEAIVHSKLPAPSTCLCDGPAACKCGIVGCLSASNKILTCPQSCDFLKKQGFEVGRDKGQVCSYERVLLEQGPAKLVLISALASAAASSGNTMQE